jgi:NAD(P)H-hydrate repair Nnr-like enzyme with NAD(P)H-hydrate epimerase domain
MSASTECANACAQLRFLAKAGINAHRVCQRCGAGYRGDGYVYAIQAGGPGGPIKIGYSRDPWRRRDELQVANASPLCLIAAEPNSVPEDERRAHRSIGPSITGEWFASLDAFFVVDAMVRAGFGVEVWP